jgi:hypothetical protein
MAISFYTNAASTLLASFDTAIRQTDPKGKIETWSISQDGKFYTHKASQWANKAWFQPEVMSDRLCFYIKNSPNTVVYGTVYGYYHGHLIETFLNHFDKMFNLGCATPLPASKDTLK